MPPLRIIFMGTADLACASLRALHREPSFQVIAVVSQPDKPKGRDMKLQPTPVKELALAEDYPSSNRVVRAMRNSSPSSEPCSRT